MTATQSQAVKDYTGNLYYENINAVLRGKAAAFDTGNHERAKQLHQALADARLPTACTVYRGTSSAALGRFQAAEDSQLIGVIIGDEGFMSTSLNREDAFSDELILEIHAPAGAHGVYVGYVSAQGHNESEVLFDKDQTMQITGVRREANGKRVIETILYVRR